MKTKIIFLVIILSTLVFALPKPTGFVNDFANILPNKAELENTLIAYGKNTTIEVAIVTIDSLPPDQTTATYAVELFQDWGIGKKGEDSGILVLIVKNGTAGNRLRIELGYGIQGYITGAEAGRILDAALIYYSAGDYGKTADVILYGLFEQLQDYEPGKRIEGERPEVYVISFLPVIFMILIIALSVHYAEKCPNCGSRKVKCEMGQEYCTCMKCGKRFKRKKRGGFIPVFFAAGSGSGGGFGGFGGGGSGGGGAGR
jgi:uncharacterized protein